MVETQKWFDGPNDPEAALDAVLYQVEDSFTKNDLNTARTLIENNFLQCWFGFNATRLVHILTTISESGVSEMSTVTLLRNFITAENPESLSDIDKLVASIGDRKLPIDLFELAVAFQERFTGNHVRALERSRAFKEGMNRKNIQPVFDIHNGWALITAVQRGITATLAGELKEALINFKEAQMHVPVPSLSFLHRDAYLRSALIEAAFGDSETAAYLLTQSRLIPRTKSWVELTLDASEKLVEILLETEDPQIGVTKLDALDLQDVGEMWPFYIIAVNHVFTLSQQEHELSKRMEMLSAVNFPRQDGEGLSGSVINVTLASLAAKKQQFSKAWDFLAKADNNIASTTAYVSLLHSITGSPQKALELSYPLREQVSGLRKLELMRFSALANAYLMLGHNDAAREVLLLVTATHRDLKPAELLFFLTPIHEFALQEIPEWPKKTDIADSFASLSSTKDDLSNDELRVLSKFAQNKNLTEVAFDLFMSQQMLAEILESIYHKLAVTSVAAAVVQAESKGYI